MTVMDEKLQLYEALLWEPGEGYFLLDLHVRRLEYSAGQLGFVLDPAVVRQRLSAFAAALGSQPRKVPGQSGATPDPSQP